MKILHTSYNTNNIYRIFFHFDFAQYMLFSFFFFLSFSCTENDDPASDPPEPPVMAGKTASSDTSVHEVMGIDAVDGPENAIRIIWKEHPQRHDLDFFNIYRSVDPQGILNYVRHGQVEPAGVFLLDSVYHTFTDVGDIEEEKAYWYYVTAVNEDGIESEPSDTVWYRLVQKARLTSPLGTNFSEVQQEITSIDFKWVFDETPLPNGYILRIEEDGINELVYIEWVEPLVDFDERFRTHSLSRDVLRSFVVNGLQYRWRIDCVEKDPLHFGSESNWGTFIINWGN